MVRLYHVSKYLAEVLGPLVGGTEQTVKNSAEFVETVTKERIMEDEEMISFDVTALYTSLPIGRAIQSVREHLEEGDTLDCRTPLSVDEILRLLEICLRSTYFTFQVLLPEGWCSNGFASFVGSSEHLHAEF